MSGWDQIPTAQDVSELEADGDLDDYLAAVYTDLAKGKRVREWHDRDAGIYEIAGSEACLALGHGSESGEWDAATHLGDSFSWDGDTLCLALKIGTACGVCESADCEGSEWMNVPTRDQFWELFSNTEGETR